jgi:hypothetical protein
MKKILLFLLIIAGSIASQSQIINLVNPSFEGNPAPHVVPPPWNICMGLTPDTQPGSWGITLPASNGNTYIGLVHEDPPAWEEGVSQNLSSPLLSGVNYYLFLDLAVPAYAIPTSGIVLGPVELEIWGGNATGSGCDQSELLWSSGNITDTIWNTHMASFTPSASYNQINLMVHRLDTAFTPYIMVDNLSSIIVTGTNGVFASTTPISCYNQCDGTATAFMIGGVAPFHYSWMPGGDTTSYIDNLCAGTYIVTVIDSNNDVYSDSTIVGPGNGNSPFSPPEICVVTVDSSTQKNKIIWEEPAVAGIDSFTIYRETYILNNYVPIGKVAYSSLSEFIDNNSFPAQQSYRYKLALIDSCGAMTSTGSPHTTIHLIVSQGMGGSWQLQWNAYVGFYYPSFHIYRGTSPNNLTYLNSIAGNLYSYTDLTPPPGVVYYRVEVTSPTPCNPSFKSDGTPYARSNVVSTNLSSVENWTNNDNLFSVYPNPANDGFNLKMNTTSSDSYDISLFNIYGELIWSKTLIAETNRYFSAEGLKEGVYIIDISNNGNHVRKKLVIQR